MWLTERGGGNLCELMPIRECGCILEIGFCCDQCEYIEQDSPVCKICNDLFNAQITSTKSGPMALGGTTSANGTSPLTIDYTVDLTAVPADALICAAEAEYMFGSISAPYGVVDDGGSVSNGTKVIWTPNRNAIRRLNAAWGADGRRDPAFPVRATGSWSGTYPPTNTFGVMTFAIQWVEPHYP